MTECTHTHATWERTLERGSLFWFCTQSRDGYVASLSFCARSICAWSDSHGALDSIIGLLRRCYRCRSRGDAGDCQDPFTYNVTQLDDASRKIYGVQAVPCASGWCGKVIEGGSSRNDGMEMVYLVFYLCKIQWLTSRAQYLRKRLDCDAFENKSFTTHASVYI